MDDMAGGAVQLVAWILGAPLFFTGLILGDVPAMTIAGGALWAGQNVYNMVRSATFGRRSGTAPATGSWNVAIAPGKNGVERVSLSRAIRF